MIQKGNKCLDDGTKSAIGNKHLKGAFITSAVQTQDTIKKHIDPIFNTIVQKTCRARCGFEINLHLQHDVGHSVKGSAIDAQRSNLKNHAKPNMEINGKRLDLEVKKRKVGTGTPGALS